MNQDITKLISHVYELEGLLFVLDKHGAETPAVVLDMIREKGALIARESELVQLPEPLQQQPPVFTADKAEQSDDDITPAEEPAVKADEPDEDLPSEKELTIEVEKEPAADEEVEIEIEQPAPFVPVTDDLDDDMPRRYDDDKPLETFGNDFSYVEPKHRSAPAKTEIEEDVVIEKEPETPISVISSTDNSEPIRLDERLQRHISKDLKRAFSVNDRFRFRRELFGNSDAEMNDALNLIEAMRDYNEAEDYFYQNLGWDANNEEVKVFMAIVKNHFL